MACNDDKRKLQFANKTHPLNKTLHIEVVGFLKDLFYQRARPRVLVGVSVATFPYVAEFNGKVKYVRDFFITIFFCGLGMLGGRLWTAFLI